MKNNVQQGKSSYTYLTEAGDMVLPMQKPLELAFSHRLFNINL